MKIWVDADAAPRDVKDILEQFTARILDLLGLDHSLGKRWGA